MSTVIIKFRTFSLLLSDDKVLKNRDKYPNYKIHGVSSGNIIFDSETNDEGMN